MPVSSRSSRVISLLLVTALAVTCNGIAPEQKAQPAAGVPEVRRLRLRLSKVLQKADALPAALVAEAKKLDTDAESALHAGTKDKLNTVLAEYKHFMADVMGLQAKIQHESESGDGNDEVSAFVSTLEGKVETIFSHIEKDSTGLNATESEERQHLMIRMTNALAGKKSSDPESMLKRAQELHACLVASHDYLEARSKKLVIEQAKLTDEINAAQAKIMYMMLRQRRKLPMKSQLAILKRHQFKGCRYAEMLLHSHNNSTPLFKQLEAVLPQKLAQLLAKKEAKSEKKFDMAAAGSNGRVLIVSSRMKNSVKHMAGMLTAARDQLRALASANSTKVSDKERKQAQHILVGLDDMLGRVNKTKDLKTQLDTMDEIAGKLQTWMHEGDRKSVV